MKTIIPAFNKTNITKAISMSPPGSHYGVLDFKNIEVKNLKDEGDEVGWKEVYIPFNVPSDSTLDLDDFATVVRRIEEIWGEVPFMSGSKGITKRNRRNCVYMCFQPKTT